jgi:hypothetical protein
MARARLCSSGGQGKCGRLSRRVTRPCSRVQIAMASSKGAAQARASPASWHWRTLSTRAWKALRPGDSAET